MRRIYELMNKAEGDSQLAQFVNQTLKRLDVVRIFVSPTTFQEAHKRGRNHAKLFYETCLWEMYLTRLVEKLQDWVILTDKYFEEFSGEWKYYASANRLDAIKNGFGDDDDYDEFGNIVTENVPIEKLVIYAITNDLVQDNWMDIVQETRSEHLETMFRALLGRSKLDITEALGMNIPVYRQDKDGKMVEMTFADKALMKAQNGHADSWSVMGLNIIARNMHEMVEKVRSLKPDRNNVEELKGIRQLASRLLDMQIDDLVLEEDRKLLERCIKA